MVDAEYEPVSISLRTRGLRSQSRREHCRPTSKTYLE